MSLPTIHWHRFAGVLLSGQEVAIVHTIRTGEYPYGVIPDAVLFDMSSGFYLEAPNMRIGESRPRTSALFYLSNFDPAARLGAHFYGVIARRYHSINGQNL